MESVRVETVLPVRSLTDVDVGQASVFMASMISFTLGRTGTWYLYGGKVGQR